jgi:hypothetical protein
MMPGRFSGFNIKTGVIVVIAGVAILTSVWLTRQIEIRQISAPAAFQPQSSAVIAGQLSELKEPLPRVMIVSKQEPSMPVAAKGKQDPFAPDWAVRPKKEKNSPSEPVTVVEVKVKDEVGEASQTGGNPSDGPLEGLSDALLGEPSGEVFKEAHKPSSDETSPPLGEKGHAETRVEEKPEAVIGYKETVTEGADETGISGRPQGFDDVQETSPVAHDAGWDTPLEPEARQKEAATEVAMEPEPDKGTTEPDELGEYPAKPEVDPPRLFVTGIITAEDASYAILRTSVSSVIVQQGDEIQGATVESIHGETVVVVKQGEEFVLELGGGGKP